MRKIVFAFLVCVLFLCADVFAQEIKRFYPGVYTPIDEPTVYDSYTPMQEPIVYDLPRTSDVEKNATGIGESRSNKTADTADVDVVIAETNYDSDSQTIENTSNTQKKADDFDYPSKEEYQEFNSPPVEKTATIEKTPANKETKDFHYSPVEKTTESITSSFGNTEKQGEENNAVINIDFDDDFDAIFQGASDVTVEEQNISIGTTTPPNNGLDAVVAKVTNNDTFPIRFSGHLEAEAGFGVVFLDPDQNMNPTFSGYFNFNNNFNISARPHKSISVRGSIRTIFPSFTFDLSELYVDVLLFDRMYLTIGRKSTSWGYTRLFGSRKIVDDYLLKDNPDARDPRLFPNVLYDSGNYYTAMFRLPLWTGTISALAMYPISSTWPQNINYKDLSYAFSVEMVFLKTSFNLFARFFERPVNLVEVRPHLYGLEVKRTILGVDFYLQGMMQGKYISQMGNINGYDVFVGTTGIYRYWDLKNGMRIGGNFEYQYAFLPHNYEKHINQIKFSGGISRMGKKNKMKIAVDLEHSFATRAGYVNLGWQYSDVFPFANWNIAAKMEYGRKYTPLPRITVGTSLNFNINY